MKTSVKGYSLVLSAYITWGVLPVFWKLLSEVSPMLVLFHRVFWSMLLLLAVLVFRRQLGEALKIFREPKVLASLVVSSALLGVNWLTYLWAMSKELFVEASIGYFMCPLLTVALGSLVCKERLSSGQKVAMLFLSFGVVLPILMHGTLSWVAVALASSWSGYTLLRKKLSVSPLVGVFTESLMLVPILFVVCAQSLGGASALSGAGAPVSFVLLFLAGLVTVAPQLALVSGVKFVPLKIVGVTQYIAPTLMLLISILYLDKQPSEADLWSFGFFWLGICTFFAGDYVLRRARDLFQPRVPALAKARAKGLL